VTADTFEAHCRLIRETCHPISLDDWRQARAGIRPLPERPVLVTFDDGYRTVLTLGQPILSRYEIPFVVFVCSGASGTRRMLWFDAVARTRGEAAVEELKRASFGDWAAATSVSIAVADEDPHAVLTPDEVRVMAQLAGCEVGSHTANHPILAAASLPVQAREITEDKRRIEEWTAKPVRAFAYPNGRPGVDYTDETVNLVRSSGFDVAFSSKPAFALPSDPPLQRSRFLMLSDVTASELAHRLCFAWAR
jgi:peptidoglycan/xylan/chitin deacetylase (PgdA/CDA1 family)